MAIGDWTFTELNKSYCELPVQPSGWKRVLSRLNITLTCPYRRSNWNIKIKCQAYITRYPYPSPIIWTWPSIFSTTVLASSSEYLSPNVSNLASNAVPVSILKTCSRSNSLERKRGYCTAHTTTGRYKTKQNRNQKAKVGQRVTRCIMSEGKKRHPKRGDTSSCQNLMGSQCFAQKSWGMDAAFCNHACHSAKFKGTEGELSHVSLPKCNENSYLQPCEPFTKTLD